HELFSFYRRCSVLLGISNLLAIRVLSSSCTPSGTASNSANEAGQQSTQADDGTSGEASRLRGKARRQLPQRVALARMLVRWSRGTASAWGKQWCGRCLRHFARELSLDF
ncbi:MAG: hypothetical protein AAFU53_06590, partial [Cyanobacteria bacterium J06632_3]